MKLGRIGSILLGAWLILQGLPKLINFALDGTILAGLAIAAGIFIFIEK